MTSNLKPVEAFAVVGADSGPWGEYCARIYDHREAADSDCDPGNESVVPVVIVDAEEWGRQSTSDFHQGVLWAAAVVCRAHGRPELAKTLIVDSGADIDDADDYDTEALKEVAEMLKGAK